MQYDWNLGTRIGNCAKRLEKNEEWFEAAYFYTEAIALRPKASLFYENRAWCYMKMNNWFLAEADSRKAIELHPRQPRTYNILGKALLHYGDLEEAIKVLQKGLDQSTSFEVDVDTINDARRQLFKALYLVWKRESPQQSSELQLLKSACESTLREKKCSMSQLKCLDEVFDKAMEAHTPAEVPHFFRCPITMEVLRDPVITSSGISYERAALLKSIARVGKVDPSSRLPLGQEHLVSNLALREAVEKYLLNNGWAYKILDDN